MNDAKNELEINTTEYALIQEVLNEKEWNDLSKHSTLLINKSRFDKVKNSTTKTVGKISTSIIAGFQSTKNKVTDLSSSTLDFTKKAGSNLKENSFATIDHFAKSEKKQLIVKILNAIDLAIVINCLNNFKGKYPKNSKELLAVTVLIFILTYFKDNKGNKEVLNELEATPEIKNILKKNSWKELVGYAEPIVVFLPPMYSVPLLLIIKLIK